MVDESSFDAEMNLRALERGGFRVTRDLVTSAEQLLFRLNQTEYDVVLSDYSLHGWTGLDALRLVKQQSPLTPLLFVTEKMTDDFAQECLKQGVQDCVLKGHLDRLPDAVRTALHREGQLSVPAGVPTHLAPEIPSLESAFEGIQDPIIVMDEHCRIQRMNHAAKQLLGEDATGILGHTCYEVLHGTHAPPENCPHRRMQATGLPETGEFSIAGKETTFDLTISPCNSPAQHFRGCVGVMRDASVRQISEHAARAANSALAERDGDLAQRESDLAVLGELEDMLQLCVDSLQAYDVMGYFAGRLFSKDSGVLRLLRHENGGLEAVASWGQQAPPPRSFSSESCLALCTGGPSDNFESGPTCSHRIPGNTPKSLCVPILGQGEVLGLIEFQVADLTENGIFSAQSATEFRRRAEILTEHLGRTLTSLSIREDLRSQSIRDPLTGLFNRRYLEEALDREVHRAMRARRPLGLIMLDLDHFKVFNDTHGHAAGDALLRAMGRLLRARIRGEDIACRYGGEEFLVILPEAPLEIASKRAEQLREEVLRLHLGQGHNILEPVTVSMGVAAYPIHGSTVGDLLAAADSHLYIAKHRGRDQVVVGEHR
jgi:diguanylate cyclase (GGDEF)-like protein/PAS domain S-box-containing protein